MYLLIDIGGTKTRIAVANSKDKEITKMKIVPTEENFQNAITEIISTTQSLTEEKIEAVGIGLATPLDKNKSKVNFHSNKKVFYDWVGKPLKEELEKNFNCQVFLENDATMGALGEAVYGPGEGKSIVAFITIGTGVGGARIVDGEIDESSLGFEPGWQIIDASGSLCPECEQTPLHLSAISGKNIKKRTGKIASEVKDEKFWNQIAKILAIGLYNTILYWSPDIILLGGSVSKDISLKKVEEELIKIPSPFSKAPEIKRAVLGEKSGLYGALQYLKSKDL